MEEVFDWKKWFTGMFDITRWGKDIGTLIRLACITAIVIACCFGIPAVLGKINTMITPKKVQPTIGDVSGGKVVTDASVNSKREIKLGILNW